jgi:hypothetical protein
MRLLFKSLVVVLLVFGIGNYLIYLKTGHMPVQDLRERWGNDWLVDVQEKYAPDQLSKKVKSAVDDLTHDGSEKPSPTKIFKWVDDNGQVHYGDKPNDNAEQVEVNMRNAISPPERSIDAVADAPQIAPPQTPIEKARAAAEAMKAHTQEQETFWVNPE